MHMSEKPLTHKVNLGEEPLSNTIWGLNATYNTESGFLTTLIDKLPFVHTKAKSHLTIDTEFARFQPVEPVETLTWTISKEVRFRWI